MKKLIKLILLLSIFAIQPITAFAESLTVDEVIKIVLEHNLQLRAEKSEEKYQSDISKSIRGKYLPALKVSATALLWNDDNKTAMEMPVVETLIQEIMPTLPQESRQRIQNSASESSGITLHDQQSYKISATVVQPVLSLYGIYNSHKSSLNLEKAAEYDVIKTERELQKNIAQIYFGMLAAMKMTENFKTAIKHLSETESIVETLLQEGRVEKNALLKILSKKAELKKGQILAEKKAENAGYLLNMLMNRKIDSLLTPVWNFPDIELELEKALSVNDTDNLKNYIEKRPEVKSLKSRSEALKAGTHIAISSFLPKLNLVFNYDFQEGFGDMQPQNQFYAGINFDWDIWEWGSSYYKIKAAQTRLSTTKLNLNLLRSKISLEINQLKSSLEKSLAEIRNAKEQLGYTRESFIIEKELYLSGKISTTDLLQVQTTLITDQNILQVKLAEAAAAYIEYSISKGLDQRNIFYLEN